ncbi:MAG: transposase [Verrucomicrobia bacterium]|nr:transposase [Verrucomicrobiota bacterium]
MRTTHLTPASPRENGSVASFRRRFRDECLNLKQLWLLTEAGVFIQDFRLHSYTDRTAPPVLSLSPLRGKKRFSNFRLRAGPPSRSASPPGIANQRQTCHLFY